MLPQTQCKQFLENLKPSDEIPSWNCESNSFLGMPFRDGKNEFHTISHKILFQKKYARDKQLMKGTCPMGYLTKAGAEQMLKVGETLRKEYIEKRRFLTEKFNENVIIRKLFFTIT